MFNGCSSVFIGVHRCSSVFINVHQNKTPGVHQGSSMFIKVHQGSSMFIKKTSGVHRCVFRGFWCSSFEQLKKRPGFIIVFIKVHCWTFTNARGSSLCSSFGSSALLPTPGVHHLVHQGSSLRFSDARGSSQVVYVHQCSSIFTNVHQYALMFIKVHQIFSRCSSENVRGSSAQKHEKHEHVHVHQCSSAPHVQRFLLNTARSSNTFIKNVRGLTQVHRFLFINVHQTHTGLTLTFSNPELFCEIQCSVVVAVSSSTIARHCATQQRQRFTVHLKATKPISSLILSSSVRYSVPW